MKPLPEIPPELLRSPNRLMVHLLPDDERDALRSLAVPRFASRELAVVLIDDAEKRERVLGHPLLKKAAWDAQGKTLKFDDGIRTALLETFQKEDAGTQRLSDLHGRLAEHYGGQGADGEREALYHRLGHEDKRSDALRDLEGQVEALLRFDDDRDVDVAKAHDLLRLVEDYASRDQEAQALLNRWRPRLVRRAYFSRDRDASRTYFERAFEQAAWQRLLDDDGRWILQLYALGGAGKTMFVRNLIGRVCPAAEIPCARIDFDYVAQLVAATNEPWRLLLLIARQLDRQLPDQPFEPLLSRWGHLEARALPQALARRHALGGKVGPGGDTDLLIAKDEVPVTFRSILAHSRDTEPVVVVLDTLENLLETEGAALRQVIDELARVRLGEENLPGVPGLRLVLCGRFDLAGEWSLQWSGGEKQTAERVPGFRETYVKAVEEERVDEHCTLVLGEQVVTVRLPAFSSEDGTKYLKDFAELPPSDPRNAAIVDKADGNPMKLALIAEAVWRDPTLTAERIRSWTSAELFYLVDRVIDRILDPEVQWLVRWGVVPRVLTRDFVDRVLWPLFLEHQSGTAVYDRPDVEAEQENLPQPSTGLKRFREVEPAAGAAAAWTRLTHYASAASWVDVTRELPDCLDFKAEVRDPMRGLLRRYDQEIYHELNRRALDYWIELAGELEGASRAAALRGAMFQAFEPWRGRPTDLGAFFGKVLALLGDQAEWRAEVAREILDVEKRARHADEGESRLESPPPEVVGRAHAEIVRFLAPTLSDDTASLTPLRQHLALARLREGEGGLIAGRAFLAEGKAEAAETSWAEALDHSPLDEEVRVLLMMELGLLRRDGTMLEQVLHETAGDQTLNSELRQKITRQLAEFHFQRENYLRSHELYEAVGDPAGMARSLIWLGRPGSAADQLHSCSTEERVRLESAIDYAFYRPFPLLALDQSEAASEFMGLEERILLKIRGLTMLGQDDRALSHLEGLMTHQDATVAVSATRQAIRLRMETRQFEAALDLHARLPPDLPINLSVQAQLLDIELRLRTRGDRSAVDELDALNQHDPSSWLPSTRVAVAVARLMVWGVDEEGLGRLLEVLKEIRSSSRRLYLLSRLRFVGTPKRPLPKRQGKEFRALTEPVDGDGPRLLLARAEVLRLCRRFEAGRNVLRPLLKVDDQHVVWRLARLGFDRLGWGRDSMNQPDPPEVYPEAFRQRVITEQSDRLKGAFSGRQLAGPLDVVHKGAASLGIDEESIRPTGGRGFALQDGDPPYSILSEDGPPDAVATDPIIRRSGHTDPGWQEVLPEWMPNSFWSGLEPRTRKGRQVDKGWASQLVKLWREAFDELGEMLVDKISPHSETILIPRSASGRPRIPWQLARIHGGSLADATGVGAVVRGPMPSAPAHEDGLEPTALALVSTEAKYDRMGSDHEERLVDLLSRQGVRYERFTSLHSQAMDAPYGVLHLVAALEERRGSVVLRLESEWGSTLGAAQLGRMLKGPFQRLVILDVPWPGSPYELAHQLLLREVFADELSLQTGRTDILLTGFSGGAPYLPWVETLAESLVAGLPLADLTGRLQRLGTGLETFEEWVVAHGTGLYSADSRRRVRVVG